MRHWQDWPKLLGTALLVGGTLSGLLLSVEHDISTRPENQAAYRQAQQTGDSRGGRTGVEGGMTPDERDERANGYEEEAERERSRLVALDVAREGNRLADAANDYSRLSLIFAIIAGTLGAVGAVFASIEFDHGKADRRKSRSQGIVSIEAEYLWNGARFAAANGGGGHLAIIGAAVLPLQPGDDPRQVARATTLLHRSIPLRAGRSAGLGLDQAFVGDRLVAVVRSRDGGGAERVHWSVFGLTGSPARHERDEDGTIYHP